MASVDAIFQICSYYGDGRKPDPAKFLKQVPVARLLATAALWVRIQTSLKNTKWATYANQIVKNPDPDPTKKRSGSVSARPCVELHHVPGRTVDKIK